MTLANEAAADPHLARALLGVCVLWLLLFILDTINPVASEMGFWAKRSSRFVLVAGATAIVAMAFATLLSGCAAPTAKQQIETKSRADLADAVVVLLCDKASAEDPSAGYSRVPCCNAFAMRTGSPGAASSAQLYTAYHCIQGKMLGNDVRYVTRGLYETTARGSILSRVVWTDEAHDRAALAPIEYSDAAELSTHAFNMGHVDESKPAVSMLCAMAQWERERGEIVTGFSPYWATSVDVVPGWSGSPVLNGRDEAIGIARACQGAAHATGLVTQKTCEAHSGLFVDFTGLGE